jgi:hypothetical protein
MFSVKIFNALEVESMEQKINEFLQKHSEIKDVSNINFLDTPRCLVGCLIYKV